MKNDFLLQLNIQHVAFIMDGNGRWANKKGLARTLGHKKALERLMPIILECNNLNFKAISFFAFLLFHFEDKQMSNT